MLCLLWLRALARVRALSDHAVCSCCLDLVVTFALVCALGRGLALAHVVAINIVLAFVV